MFSKLAVKLYSAVRDGIIKSNTHFWRNFSKLEETEFLKIESLDYEKYLLVNDISLVCVFDKDFPEIPDNLKSSEKPFLFAYKGNISLLKDINHNVAVIGCFNISKNDILRIKGVIKYVKLYLKCEKCLYDC